MLDANEISKVQQWHRHAVAKALLDRYQREGDDFLGRIVTMDEAWARSYEPNLKRQSDEWKHPSSPRPKKVRPIQCAVKVMFIVDYDIYGVVMHHDVPTSTAEGKRCVLLYVPAAPTSSSAQEKTMRLGGTETQHSS